MSRGRGHGDPAANRGGRKRRLWLRLAAIAFVVLAVGGHWAVHYRPRVRALPDSARGAVGRLWASPEAELAVWVAYPHQNLGMLERRIGDLDSYLADVGVLLDDTTLRLPRFGPFRFPPARELVAVEVDTEPNWRAVAQVYPLVGLAARGAGRLASNPWLAGGELSAGGNVVRIGWQGNLWSFGTWQAGNEPAPARGEALIGRLRLDEARGLWPSGSYDLSVDGANLWLAEHGVGPATLRESTYWPVLDGVPLVLRETTGEGQRLLLFFDDGGGTIPSVASITEGSERFDLPGERLFQRLGAEVVEMSAGGWTLAAYSDDDLERARGRLALFSRPAAIGRSARLAAGPVAHLSRGLGETLAEIPIIGEREARRWLALARLLEPLGESGVVEVSLADPVFLRLSVDAETDLP